MFSCLMLPPTVVAEAKLFSEEKNVFLIVFFSLKAFCFHNSSKSTQTGKHFGKKSQQRCFLLCAAWPSDVEHQNVLSNKFPSNHEA